VALAKDPPFRFVDNTAAEVAEYLRNITTFVGFGEAEVAAVETRVGRRFPAMFREFLLRMGRRHGDLFCGSDVATLDQLDEFKAEARSLMAGAGVDAAVLEQAIVFFIHQGYSFLFFVADGGDDAPVWAYVEGRSEPTIAADSFAAVMDGYLRAMEANHVSARERGGYYATVADGRVVREVHPALASGDRPLDRPQRFRTWWAFWR
jgi:hypothetical protein